MFKTLAVACLALALSNPAPAQAANAGDTQDWTLERVVVVMRHGVRPPTKAEPLPAGEAQQPWPAWDVDWGYLTAHGAQAVARVGEFDRATYAGFLGDACPTPHDVHVIADSDERTVKTAETYVGAMFAGCTVPVEHLAEGQKDPRFAEDGGIDPATALAAAQSALPPGGLAAVDAQHADGLKALTRILGCTHQACDLSQQPAMLDTAKGHLRLSGGIATASTFSEILALEYAEGKPMDQVGWGRTDRAEIARLLQFHALDYVYTARPKALAQAGARALLAEVRRGLYATDSARYTLLVGHDGNIAHIGGALDLHWQGGDFAQDDPPPAGALIFELWRDKTGGGHVMVRFRSQTLDEMRNLTPLAPDASKALPLPQCNGALSCDAKVFEAALPN
jgi:4-phytase/acid phosphatase